MMKKKYKINMPLFISSIILGFLIVLNINLDTLSTTLQLSAVEYKDAIEEREALYKEISNLKEENKETTEKIKKYNESGHKSPKIIEDMKSQVADYATLNGTRPASGPGIVIKITDGKISKGDSNFEAMSRIFHDNDMALVLNEVRNAGAEAIAVNNHRVMVNTGVICNWAFIGFEDDSMESAPFYVYAIGDPDRLEESLLQEGSHIQKLIIRKLNIEIEKKDNITIPGTEQKNGVNYMKRYEKN